jgi:4-hydroxy-3-methylbut-2-enyl diphosphate reductase
MCMGVNLALSKLDALIARMPQPGSLFILGSIIHNPQVVRAYAEKGVITVQSPAEIPAGATAVIRAHGVTKEVEKELCQRGVQIVDATCPKVKAACLLIEKHTATGRVLLLYGEATHPEVKCLLSYAAAGAFVCDSREACAALTLDPAHSYCLAAQTTQDKAIFKEISTELKNRVDLDLIVLDTICDATRERQDEAVRIAREVDFVVVAGGYESSNTRRLAQVVLAQGTPALHIETAADLPLVELQKYQRIGLTAGASTPKAIVDEIQRVLETL